MGAAVGTRLGRVRTQRRVSGVKRGQRGDNSCKFHAEKMVNPPPPRQGRTWSHSVNAAQRDEHAYYVSDSTCSVSQAEGVWWVERRERGPYCKFWHEVPRRSGAVGGTGAVTGHNVLTLELERRFLPVHLNPTCIPGYDP